jgi:hypothetical protein
VRCTDHLGPFGDSGASRKGSSSFSEFLRQFYVKVWFFGGFYVIGLPLGFCL